MLEYNFSFSLPWPGLEGKMTHGKSCHNLGLCHVRDFLDYHKNLRSISLSLSRQLRLQIKVFSEFLSKSEIHHRKVLPNLVILIKFEWIQSRDVKPVILFSVFITRSVCSVFSVQYSSIQWSVSISNFITLISWIDENKFYPRGEEWGQYLDVWTGHHSAALTPPGPGPSQIMRYMINHCVLQYYTTPLLGPF